MKTYVSAKHQQRVLITLIASNLGIRSIASVMRISLDTVRRVKQFSSKLPTSEYFALQQRLEKEGIDKWQEDQLTFDMVLQMSNLHEMARMPVKWRTTKWYKEFKERGKAWPWPDMEAEVQQEQLGAQARFRSSNIR